MQPFPSRHRHTANLPLEVTSGHQLRQAAVTGVVLAQQHQRKRPLRFVAIEDSKIETNKRLDAGSHSLAIEFHQAEKVVLIRQCDGRHRRRRTAIHERRNPHRTIDE